jgi:hypothetical protein
MANLKNLFVAPLGAVFIALGTASTGQAAQLFGDSQPLGDGFIRSYVTIDDVTENPSDIGVVFTQGVQSLPTGAGNSDITIELSLPSEASTTGFKQIEVNYRPNGYPPGGEINVPQFNVNFLRLSSQERDTICPNPVPQGPVLVCAGDELAKALETPQPGTLPESVRIVGFGRPVATAPRYGARYVAFDLAAPAVQNPQSLTSFYGYTFYDGQQTATNLVVGKAFLETQPQDVTTSIEQPTAYSKSGYYPTEYSIDYERASQEYSVSLTGLTYHSATPVPEPSSTLGLLTLGAWGALSHLKNKLKKQKLGSQ